MQVATLFREAATLLGATMEAPDGPGLKMPGYSDGNPMMKQEQHYQDGSVMMKQDTPHYPDGTPVMKQEPQHYSDGTPMMKQDTPRYPDGTPLMKQDGPHYSDGTPLMKQDGPHYSDGTSLMKQDVPHYPDSTPHMKQDGPHYSDGPPHMKQEHYQEGPSHMKQEHYPDGSSHMKEHYQDGSSLMKDHYQDSSSHMKEQHYQDGTPLMKQEPQHYQDTPHMKQEPTDDGYETSGDLDLRGQSEASKMMSHQQLHAQMAHMAHHQAMMGQMVPQQHQHPHPHHPHHPHPHHPHPHGHMHHPHPHQHPHQHPHPHHPHVMQGGSVIKYEMQEDPYSFVDDDRMPMQCPPAVMQQAPKKRGRKKKIKPEDQHLQQQMHGGMVFPESLMNPLMKPLKDPTVKAFKERKKHDRFNGMPEEEVSKRTLPDHLTQNLDIVIIGINPGLFAAYKGHHYAGPGNHFWKCLYLSGLTPEPMTSDDDYKLLKVGIGFTNMVERATKGSADLTRKEIKEGSQILLEKLRKFKPKIAVFNGKLIFEVFSGKKDFSFGRQPEMVDGTNTYMWVMPSSSARCAQLPRAADKVPFYAALKKFRDYLNGLVPELDEKEIVFTYSKLKNFFEPDVKEEPKDGQLCNYGGYNGRMGDGLTDLTSSVLKRESQPPGEGPPKKKRGRPKKIKVEGEAPPEKKEKPPKEVYDKDGNLIPKKKRGRPKKIKPEPVNNSSTEQQQQPPPQPAQTNNNSNSNSNNNGSGGSGSGAPTPSVTPNCFSPPIQSPVNLCQQGFSQMYNNQNHTYNHSADRSPLSTPNMNRSPLSNQNLNQSPHNFHQSHGYNQSPQPPSFTHSDLSSEISAAISSEQNVCSRSPNSSSLGAPPEFEPAVASHEENSKSSSDVKDEISDNPGEQRFTGPTPSKNKSPEASNYQNNYEEYSGDSETDTTRYPRRPSPAFAPKPTVNQDVASKSLSGLESLVDQIPNIGDGESGHTAEPMDSVASSGAGQYSDDSAYLSDYPRVPHYSPQYPTAPATPMNFSVTSLANSSATDTSSSFSVSSLASNYNNAVTPPVSYPVMGPPHPHPHPMDPCVNMPYPYNQYSVPSPYPAPSSAPFPYSTSHNIHVPSPNFPYPSPYSNSGYPQSGYLQSHMFDRIKNERMDIGFGGF